MQASLLTNLLLPLALGIIMLGLGLGLTLDDFRRVARYPRAVLIGLGRGVTRILGTARDRAPLARVKSVPQKEKPKEIDPLEQAGFGNV